MEQSDDQIMGVMPVSELPDGIASSLKNFDCGDKFLNQVAHKQLIKKDKQNLHKGLVFIEDGRVVAYATTKLNTLEAGYFQESGLGRKVPTLSLEQIATDLNYRRRKIASKLLKRVLQTAVGVAESHGMYGLHLWSHPDAIPFYENLGFTRLSTEKIGDIDLTLMFMPTQSILDAMD